MRNINVKNDAAVIVLTPKQAAKVAAWLRANKDVPGLSADILDKFRSATSAQTVPVPALPEVVCGGVQDGNGRQTQGPEGWPREEMHHENS